MSSGKCRPFCLGLNVSRVASAKLAPVAEFLAIRIWYLLSSRSTFKIKIVCSGLKAVRNVGGTLIKLCNDIEPFSILQDYYSEAL